LHGQSAQQSTANPHPSLSLNKHHLSPLHQQDNPPTVLILCQWDLHQLELMDNQLLNHYLLLGNHQLLLQANPNQHL
jgi:hypothetical protein